MRNIFLTSLIFIISLYIGFVLAERNPIENDESYSQHNSIQKLSYVAILQGKVQEGNNCPLFYILQKGFGQITKFELRTTWVMEQFVCEKSSQWMMRFLPIVFMSTGIALCFYYFYERYGILAAFIAAGLFMTTPMTWIYWAQDRPYGLWILLTSAQTILLSEYFIFNNKTPAFWCSLTLTHWLLCLCSGFGMAQTLLAYTLIRKEWLTAFILPAAVGIFYALHAPRYHFRVPTEWTGLIFANLPIERLALLVLGAFALKKFIPITLWLSSLLGFGLLLIASVFHQHTPGIEGFELSARYLLFLLPASIIVLNIFWLEISKKYANNGLVRLALIQSFVLILMLGGWRTVIVLHRLL